jgi:hypothetical protein
MTIAVALVCSDQPADAWPAGQPWGAGPPIGLPAVYVDVIVRRNMAGGPRYAKVGGGGIDAGP